MAAYDLSSPVALHHAAPQKSSLLDRLVAAFSGWSELRSTRKALHALSDRELADIGLHRGEIDLIGR